MRARESVLIASSSFLHFNIGVVGGVSIFKSASLEYHTFEFLLPRVCQLYCNCINRDRGNTKHNAADPLFLLSPFDFFIGG